MGVCDVCGNEYANTFTVTTAQDATHTFDSFECAIHLVAPVCAHCGCAVIGHGVQAYEQVYCCAHCADVHGVRNVSDNATHPVNASDTGREGEGPQATTTTPSGSPGPVATDLPPGVGRPGGDRPGSVPPGSVPPGAMPADDLPPGAVPPRPALPDEESPGGAPRGGVPPMGT